jgi:hypothetical protein
MPVTRHWLPVEDGFEKQLLERLVGVMGATTGSFVKGLRYNRRALRLAPLVTRRSGRGVAASRCLLSRSRAPSPTDCRARPSRVLATIECITCA